MKNRILLIGYLEQEQNRRIDALIQAGFSVVQATTETAESVANRHRPFGAVIFGHGVPEQVRNPIARSIKTRSPGCKIVMLHMGSLQNTELADAVIGACDDAALIGALHSLGFDTRSGEADQSYAPGNSHSGQL